jgi:hypothetical protein
MRGCYRVRNLSEWKWEFLAFVCALGIGVLLGIALPAGDTKPLPPRVAVTVNGCAISPDNSGGGIVQVGRV